MSILVEFQGSRRVLTLTDGILSLIEGEIRNFDPNAAIDIAAGESNTASPTRRRYILQKWSEEWGCYVDVTDTEQIKAGDKLLVVPKPLVASEGEKSGTACVSNLATYSINANYVQNRPKCIILT